MKKVAKIQTLSGYLSEIFSITELYTHLTQSRTHTLHWEHPVRADARQRIEDSGESVHKITHIQY